jgi:CubicO group peptidase (beta-lactamase class C family)
MNSTLMLAEDLKKATNAATPHSFINGKMSVIPIPDLDNLGPAASMSSNAMDMSKWLIALINKEKTALSSKAMMAIRQPYSTIRVDGRDKQLTHFSLYGLGLEIKDRNGKMVYSHTGGVDGFFSSLMFVPEENLGIVVMTNNDQNNFYISLSSEIRDAFLGLPYFNFSEKSYKGFEANKAKEKANIDSLKQVISKKNAMPASAENLVGEYKNKVYGKIEVKMDKKKNLSLHFSNHPNLVGTLEHISNGNFLCSYNNPTFGVVQIPFKIENGKVKGMTLVVADFVEFTTYDFKKI